MKNAATALILLLATAAYLPSADNAAAASKEEVFSGCAEQIAKEFGASPVEFNKFRRNDGRQMAFGTITLSDGSKRQIRCRMRKGRVLETKFRTDGQGSGAWSKERPPAAVYVDPEEAEARAAEEKEPFTGWGGEQTGWGATARGWGAEPEAEEEDAKDEEAAEGEEAADGAESADEKTAEAGAEETAAGDAEATPEAEAKPEEGAAEAAEAAAPASRFKKVPGQ